MRVPDRHSIIGTELVTKRDAKHRLRHGIFSDWGSDCAYCGGNADTLDHVTPRARGGLTVRENLIPACRRCNYAKGHSDALEWFKSHHGWSIEREQRLLNWIAA